MLPRVLVAQLVSAKVIKDRRRVLNVARVNLMTLLVPRHVHLVTSRRSLVAKEETKVALLAQRVGRPKTAVRNAKRAVQERSVMIAKIAQWGLHEKEMTLMRRNADNVHWGKQRRLKVRPRAVGVTWVRTAVPKAIVRPAQPVNTKTAKAKHPARNAMRIPT